MESDHFANIFTAQAINRLSGGNIVAPWEVEQLPEEWLIAYSKLAEQLPTLREKVQRIEATRQAILSKHPTFGKAKQPSGKTRRR